MKRCAIIIPCYNEADRIKLDVFADFMQRNEDIIFVFVNDGSSDNTREVLKMLCNNSQAHYLELTENSGKAEAVRQGILSVCPDEVDYVGFWDADLASPLEEILWMLTFADDETLYLSGCRLLRLGGNIQRKTCRHLLGRLFATIIAWHLGIAVYDTQCGAKLFAASEIQALFQRKFVTHWFFDVELIRRLICRHGKEKTVLHSVEVPLHSWTDVSGSKLRYWVCLKDFLKLLFTSD